MEYSDIDTVNVLYIEDDEALYRMVSEFFKHSKHTKFNVVSRTTLEEGLIYLTSHCLYEIENKVDIVLLDLVLPNSRGINTFKTVKQACPYLPIVIVSAYEDIACECVKLGAQDYLVKPDINRNLLIRSIKYAIHRHVLENAYRNSEEKYRKLVEATGAAIFEVDFDTMKFTYVNDTICEYSGYSREEMLQMSPLDFLTEESAKKFHERLQRMDDGEYISDATAYETVNRYGKVIWIMVTSQFQENTMGRVVGANVVAIDITETAEEEARLKKKEQELYSILDNKIRMWRKEIIKKEAENQNKLKLISHEISSMVHNNNSNSN